MNPTIAALLLVFSFSAATAKESSAIAELKKFEPAEEKCKTAREEVGKLKGKDAKLSKANFPKALALLDGANHPSDPQLSVIRNAMSEDPAVTLPMYFKFMGCATVRNSASRLLLDYAKSTEATKEEKDQVREAVKAGLLKPNFETFIDTMIDASILSQAYASGLYKFPTSDTAALEKLKKETRAKTEAYTKKIKSAFVNSEETFEGEALTKKLKADPNYEKNKGIWMEEIVISRGAQEKLRSLATKLN